LTVLQARRYRRIHRLLWFSPFVIFLSGLVPASATDEGSVLHVVVALSTLFGAGAALVAVVLYQRWLLKFIDPGRELRSEILKLRSINSWWAVRELLDQAVLHGGGKPE
jgi:hypothetical protein